MLSNSIDKHSIADYISNLKVTVYLTSRTVSANLKNDNQICIEKEDGSCQLVNIDSIRRMVRKSLYVVDFSICCRFFCL